MSTLKLMFHDDWEIYGDGTGDVDTLMIEPASRILEACDRYQVPYTFFAEFGQQLAMKDSSYEKHRRTAEKWEGFLKKAVENGHDVQLHFHPQWINAAWENNEWQLNFKKWSIASLPYEESYQWLNRGKKYLEDLLQPSNIEYRTVAFRAGSWMAQPSSQLIKALKDIGVLADCTVMKGRINNMGPLGSIDFSHAPSSILPWYSDNQDVASLGDKGSGLLCIPTYAERTYLPPAVFEILYNLRSFFFWNKRNIHFYLKLKNYRPKFSGLLKRDQPEFKFVSHFNILGKLFKGRIYYLDFGKYHYRTIYKTISNILKECHKLGLQNVPLILCTHSKDFYAPKNFNKLLSLLSDNPEISFQTTQHTIEEIDNHLILRRLDTQLV